MSKYDINLWPQRCKICGKPNDVNFHVNDKVWLRIVPTPYQKSVVCLGCFDSFASQKGVDYVHALNEELHFAGQMGSFVATIKSRCEAKI